MEVLMLLGGVIGFVYYVSRDDGSVGPSVNPVNKSGGGDYYYRHVDGRCFRYVGSVSNQNETAYVLESERGAKQIVGSDFFSACFRIAENEFFACRAFEAQRPKQRPNQNHQPMPNQGGYQVGYQAPNQRPNQGSYQVGYQTPNHRPNHQPMPNHPGGYQVGYQAPNQGVYQAPNHQQGGYQIGGNNYDF